MPHLIAFSAYLKEDTWYFKQTLRDRWFKDPDFGKSLGACACAMVEAGE